MKRRNFLQTASAALAAPIIINGLPVKGHAKVPLWSRLFEQYAAEDRVLVIMQLNGGNDGLNTIIPLDQYARYRELRENVAIPEAKALRLTTEVGLHPAMSGIKEMFDDGIVTVVQGVTYPSPNQSHFRSNDIWMSGSASNEYLSTGWAGRALELEFPNYPEGYPNAQYPDPPAIQIGALLPLALQGHSHSMAMAIQDPNTFYQLVNGTKNGTFATPPDTKYGEQLEYIRQVQNESILYSGVIKAAADKAPNKATYPTGNSLADQLKIVARLVAGGLKTRVYWVTINGFDTHAAQVDGTDTTIGAHATLLGRVSSALKSFFDDLSAHGIQDKVLAMTFSEFGRRASSNFSLGTDHGTAAPMIVVGSKVIPGMRGTNPNLNDLDRDNLKMQFDFRNVYRSILAQWFGFTSEQIGSALPGTFESIPIVNAGTTSAVQDGTYNTPTMYVHPPFPNPAHDATVVGYNLPNDADVSVSVVDQIGRTVLTTSYGYQSAGENQVVLDVSSLAVGSYYCEVRAGRLRSQRMLTVVR